MNANDTTDQPVSITLPDGEIIVVDGVPYEGWGYEPGRKYTIGEIDSNGRFVWSKTWIIPRVSRKS